MEASMERVVKELRRVVADAEALLDAGGEQLGAARGAAGERLARARERLGDMSARSPDAAGASCVDVDRYAHEHPWQVAGIGLAAAVAAVLVALLVLESRRDSWRCAAGGARRSPSPRTWTSWWRGGLWRRLLPPVTPRRPHRLIGRSHNHSPAKSITRF